MSTLAYPVCLQSLDLGGPTLEQFAFRRHAWVIDDQRLDFSKYEPVVLTRTYRCLRCGEAWSISGEPVSGFPLG